MHLLLFQFFRGDGKLRHCLFRLCGVPHAWRLDPNCRLKKARQLVPWSAGAQPCAGCCAALPLLACCDLLDRSTQRRQEKPPPKRSDCGVMGQTLIFMGCDLKAHSNSNMIHDPLYYYCIVMIYGPVQSIICACHGGRSICAAQLFLCV